jgi:hypothetical protein
VELWKQIALRYEKQPKSLMFELLNEPNGQLDDERWQEAFPQLVKAIRGSNPDRIILIGPAYWNAFDRLDKMQLPLQDRRIIGTFHYYKPCSGEHLVDGRGSYCLNIGGVQIDDAVARAFIAALEPAKITATLAAAEQLRWIARPRSSTGGSASSGRATWQASPSAAIAP